MLTLLERPAQVLFDEWLASTCSYTFTPSELEAACVGSTNPLLAALNLSLSTPSAAAYIGVYGDSHPSREQDWVPLTLTLPTSGLERVWDAPSQTCRNMLGGIQLSILSADVGNVLLPVRKVVGAQLQISSQTLTVRNCPLGQQCGSTLSVWATVSFTTLPREGRAYEFVPQTPQWIPSLPSDFFYPFYLGDNSPDASSA